ncbi:MAG: hypothetical protein J6X18_01000 [Bacteroidales bacterium]|nr:hypothetical protein [Bacteroidales bacterium]
METTLTILSSIILGFVWGYAFGITNKRSRQFNTKSATGNHDINFKITKLDITHDDDDKRICRYTLGCCFFNDGKNRHFIINDFVFYDEVGKYNLDDVFTITKR